MHKSKIKLCSFFEFGFKAILINMFAFCNVCKDYVYLANIKMLKLLKMGLRDREFEMYKMH